MNRERTKKEYEKAIFLHFLSLSNLEIATDSITSGNPNKQEPDILCKYIKGGTVGFELGRLTDPILSAEVNAWEPENGKYIRTKDHSGKITRKKLTREYQVSFPVELLLYRENPIVTPENVIIPSIRPICGSIQHGYKRIWFMGKTVEVIYENS